MISVATFNTHKGFTHFNARFSLQSQRDMLRKLNADVIFLQELQDTHIKHRARFNAWSTSGQLEYLADSIWSQYAYGKNAAYPAGHHGNALLSKFPITHSFNQDISAHSSEQRGMLHCVIHVPEWELPLHTICLHLGLFAKWRRKQLLDVAHFIEQQVPVDAPLIIAGDFNDWSTRAGDDFAKRLQLKEVFEHHLGTHARSFPAWLPILKIDRIYVRGFDVKQVKVHGGPRFLALSDHAMLTATLERV
jgi:endonuclease/exonuclease/phosphatase family metal-dependent hydrolase